MSTPTSGPTPTPAQEVEQQTVSKVHQFFDDVETAAKSVFGTLSEDAKNLFAKLRGQVHQDVQQADQQVQQDIAVGKTEAQQLPLDFNNPTANHQP